MANGEIQLSGLPQAALPIQPTDLFHLKQGITDVKCSWTELLQPHADLKNNPHAVTKDQVKLGNVTNDAQLKIASNLADVDNKATSRTNLDVYSKAETAAQIKIHTDKTDNPHKVTKDQVGLSNVPNKAASDAFRTVSDTLATTKAVNDLFKAIQAQDPVGTIHLSFNPANPSTYKLCGGTWALMGQGRTLVGFAGTLPTDTPFNGHALKAEFGDSVKTITANNLPAHVHNVTLRGGGHSHHVAGAVSNVGDHQHTAAGGVSGTDLGTKGVYIEPNGNHQHEGWTDAAGQHQHQYAADDHLPAHWGTANAQAARYDADSDSNRWSPTLWTSPEGNHQHHFWTGAAGNHGHNASVAIGWHDHSFSVVTSGSGAHGHNFDVNTDGADVAPMSGTTDNNATANAPLNVEQPSIVVYIWQRTA